MSAKFFNDEIAYVENIITERLHKLRTQSDIIKKPDLILYANARDYLELIFLSYSAGHSIEDIQKRFEPAVNGLADYLASPSAKVFDFKNIDDYIWAIRLASLSILLNASPALVTKISTFFKNNNDELFDRLIASLTTQHPIEQYLYHPHIFSPLLSALDASPEKCPTLIDSYLSSWYQNMADTYWYDAHKGPDSGGFVGYWAFEAAAVCALTKTDISLLKNDKYFPRDIL